MAKPFFFRIDLTELYDFATEPEGMNMPLLQFAKELKKGQSDFPAIQRIIDEAQSFIAKKAESGKKGMESRYLNKPKGRKELNTVITSLGSFITTDNTDITSSSSSNNSSTETEALKPIVKRFVPPSVEEVKEYMQEIGFNGDAQKWVDFYTGKGWMVGKNKMVNWKAAVRTWKGNDNGSNRLGSGTKEAGRKTGFVEANGPDADWLGTGGS